jgi:DNA-binding NarL/FixJ family response regulator
VATAAKLDPKLEALGLAPRVLDVLALLLHGHSNKAIANHLGISPNTVTGYVSTILKRLEVSSRSQVPLRVRALQRSLLEWDHARQQGAAL